MEYVARGGHLVVQYNVRNNPRFSRSSGLATERLGPYPLTLSRQRVSVEGAPSLRIGSAHTP